MGLFRKNEAGHSVVSDEQISALRKYVDQHLGAYQAEQQQAEEKRSANAAVSEHKVQYSFDESAYDVYGITDLRRFLDQAEKDSALFGHPAMKKAYHEWEKKNAARKTFSSEVMRLLKELEILPSEFYHRAGIDKRVFHSMKKDYMYKPSKETAFRCCVGLRLSYESASRLLQLAGYSLSPGDSRELVLRFCLENRIFDIYSINCLLNVMGEKELK